MKRSTWFGIVGLSIVVACAAQVPAPQKKGTFKKISEADVKNALNVEAKPPKAVSWKQICMLGPSRLSDGGGNNLLIRQAMEVSTSQTVLMGVHPNPNSGSPQSTISVYFYVPRAGKTVGLVFDFGVLSSTSISAEFEIGALDKWTKKRVTLPGPVAKTFTPAGAGLHVMAIKMSSNSSYLFKSVKVYQVE